MPFHTITTTDSVESISVGDLQRVPARCSIRPVRRSKLQVAVCSRGDASHGLFVTSPRDPGKPRQRAVRDFRSIRQPAELPFAPDPGCTAQPRVHGSKFHINPSSWAPPRSADSALCLASPEVYRERPPALQPTCSCPSTPSPRLIRSKVSVGDLQRVPAKCSIRPVRRSKLQVAVCSRADASHGLFLRHRRAVRQDAREHITRFSEYKTACRAPIRTCTELYGSATSAWVKVLP